MFLARSIAPKGIAGESCRLLLAQTGGVLIHLDVRAPYAGESCGPEGPKEVLLLIGCDLGRDQASQNRRQGDPAVRDEAVDAGLRGGIAGDSTVVRGQ